MKCVFLIAQFCMFYEKSYIDRYVILMLSETETVIDIFIKVIVMMDFKDSK